MDMREIQVFRAVMQAGTTSKAATLLGVSQPAVSQAIRKLETSSELRLFERLRGRLVPTQEAAALMEEVDRCFAGFELIEHRIRSLKSYGVGRLAIGSLPALGTGFMPRAIAAFGLEERRIQLSFQIMSSREVLQQVAAGQLDFGLMADELSVAGLEHSDFLRIPGVIAMHSRHALASKPCIALRDLADHKFIALNPEDASRRRLEAALNDQGLALQPILETPYSNSVCEFALHGLGIGMVHPVMALDYLARGLVLKPLALDISFTSLLVFRPGTPLSENARALLKVMRIQLDQDLKRVRAALGA
ncbi:LysR substrate-binding domain-containing protein [Achromobacter pestifer]|uniref:Octopine catabolism/uptake operon regulatory protein OccR n=1 Tax=Achromobacter pestifer TaxID=1353889 RepID=A0A6S6YJQ7_9BURK|nr:LysR substrate-binding domain-containing protein [Achromobacter pestifer]CAB3628355.1 Octopine catabolism/uptake operon regulatory protein OccR [Achromobacter pestifer]